MFFAPAPLLLKQSYLVVMSVVVAFVFTFIPQWTTWLLLVMMALYDIVAVLTPGGPLRMLLDVAEERDEDIPALIYEARPVQRGRRGGGDEEEEYDLREHPSAHRRRRSQQRRIRRQVGRDEGVLATTLEVQENEPHGSPTISTTPCTSDSDSGSEEERDAGSRAAIPQTSRSNSPESASDTPLILTTTTLLNNGTAAGVETDAGIGGSSEVEQPERGYGNSNGPNNDEDSSTTGFHLPDAIRLGLGDFIFYSVLVGRAAMYDMFTVFSCFIAIIAGLGCTLLWLSVTHHALPALPISIALAVCFYFASRFVMEPVILPMNLRLVFF